MFSSVRPTVDHARSSAAVDRRVVAAGPALGQHPALLQLDLVRDAQDLQLLGDRAGVAVDPDDLLVALLQRLLVDEGRLGDLGR